VASANETILTRAVGSWLPGGGGTKALEPLIERLGDVGGDGLLAMAQAHGLGPLIYHLLRPCRDKLDAGIWLSLQAVYLRERALAMAQGRMLVRIARQAEQEGIQLLALKGAALGGLIYGDPALRPKSDLDLLVSVEQLGKAADLLHGLGFRPRLDAASAQASAKHLPPIIRQIDRQTVVVELHHGLSVHQGPERSTVSRLMARSQSFELDEDGTRVQTLSPADMLRHLCDHLCDHAVYQVRLIWLLDIAGWAESYRDQVDWGHMAGRAPRVAETLALLDRMWPLSFELRSSLGMEPGPELELELRQWPTPWGRAMRELGRGRFIKELFFPSAWWLRLYYALGPVKPIWPHRWLLHPFGMAARLWRYFLKKMCFKVKK
jgi:hypothetical protein